MSDTEKDQILNSSKKSSPTESLLQVALHRFKIAAEAESLSRQEELDDQRFMIGEQWPLDIKNQRILDARPCLTINLIPQYVRQITNDVRQNRPSIKINPVDDGSDVETAKVFQGIIRHVEYASHSDVATDCAVDWAAKSGLGYFRITTDYIDPISFQQEPKIKAIKDRFSVYVDPFYQEPDGSDIDYAFVFEQMSRDEYKSKYPDSELSQMSDWSSLGDVTQQWVQKDGCRVSEYYYKVFEEIEIAKLSNGSIIEVESLEKIDLPEGVTVVQTRKTIVTKIKWAKINGVEVLEETDVPGPWIPVIPVIGEEQNVEGKRVFAGIVRHAKDPQRMYNFWKSAQAETIALAPKAPFIGYAGQFEGFEDKWKTANTKNHAYLEVNSKTITGDPAPLPQRTNYEPPVQAITASAEQASNDLKATTGIYDSELGNRSNETSGVAIQRRNNQSQTSNFHFSDNLARSLRHAGRILVNWIPKIYDTAQVVRIIGDDGEVDFVKINQIFQEDGEEKSFFLDHGTYDVTVDTGPSYQTKRQEAVASMIDLTRAIPQSMQFALDILVRHMDWPEAKLVADRIKKSLPPQITSDDKDQQLPPEVQQKLNTYSQMTQAMAKEIHDLTQKIESKQFELASKERIATLDAETRLKVELLKHGAQDGQLAFQEEMAEIRHIREQLSKFQSQLLAGPLGGDTSATAPVSNQPTDGSSSGQPMGANP